MLAYQPVICQCRILRNDKMERGEDSMKDIVKRIGMLILVAPIVLFLNACGVGNGDGVNDPGPISSGKILFAANNTTNPDAGRSCLLQITLQILTLT
jgi:hypothetical protein